MATRKTTVTTEPTAEASPRTTKAAPRRRTTKAAAETPVIEVPLSTEEAQARLREQIAVEAYLLWQSGVPGDQHSHWLAAEQAVRSA